MTLEQLKKKVSPGTVEVDSSGCVEIVAPDGFCFEHTLHILVTDPAMCDYPKPSKLYQLAWEDFDMYTNLNVKDPASGKWVKGPKFQKCADTCSCKEVTV